MNVKSTSINMSVYTEELHSNSKISDCKTRNLDVNADVNTWFNLSCSTHSLMQERYFFKIP